MRKGVFEKCDNAIKIKGKTRGKAVQVTPGFGWTGICDILQRLFQKPHGFTSGDIQFCAYFFSLAQEGA